MWFFNKIKINQENLMVNTIMMLLAISFFTQEKFTDFNFDRLSLKNAISISIKWITYNFSYTIKCTLLNSTIRMTKIISAFLPCLKNYPHWDKEISRFSYSPKRILFCQKEIITHNLMNTNKTQNIPLRLERWWTKFFIASIVEIIFLKLNKMKKIPS